MAIALHALNLMIITTDDDFITAPPPPPPKNRIYVQEREGGDRDSGLWSGSAYDTVNEWTKHHDKPPTGSWYSSTLAGHTYCTLTHPIRGMITHNYGP